MIQHLVLSGGAIVGFAFYGTLQTLIEHEYLNMDDIQTIHATSVGTLIAVSITLGYELDILKTYLMDRPWKDVYILDFSSFVRAIKEGGMFGRPEVLKTIEPLLLGKDLSVDITLEEFYEFNKKEIHFYTTKYASLELVDLSYKTHPTWKLVDAVFASCCLPVLFIPMHYEEHYYIDGAVIMNYPLQRCLDQGHDANTILGLDNAGRSENDHVQSRPFSSPSSPYKLFDFILSLSMKLWCSKRQKRTDDENNVSHQISVVCPADPISIFKAFDTKEERLNLYQTGKNAALAYIEDQKLK
jgi:predicted acylesterase/phospholipase RssA